MGSTIIMSKNITLFANTSAVDCPTRLIWILISYVNIQRIKLAKLRDLQIWNYQSLESFELIEGKIFPSHICQKCGICWQKTWKGCQTTLKFGIQKDFVVLWKKPENNVLVQGPLHCENGPKSEKLDFCYFFQFLLKGFK